MKQASSCDCISISAEVPEGSLKCSSDKVVVPEVTDEGPPLLVATGPSTRHNFREWLCSPELARGAISNGP